MNELRDFGDGKTMVLFSDDKKVIDKVSGWKECSKCIAYEQEQYSKKRVALVGWDMYLPKKKRLITRLTKLSPALKFVGFSEATPNTTMAKLAS